jgi:signal transduction histidine kinase/ABC-type amino acid transport substrate-binding protein
MKYFKRVLYLTLFFVLSLELNAKELQKVSLQLMWVHQFQFAGYYMAKEKGFYKDVGLEVELKPYSSNIDVVKDVEDGKSTYGIGRSSLVIDMSRGAKIKLLAAIFQSSPLVLLSLQNNDLKTLIDFIDKKIMIASDTTATAALMAMMRHKNVNISAMHEIEHSYNIDDLIAGRTDLMAAYISNEPFLLKEKGYKYRVFDPRDHGFDFYSDILFTSEKEISEHRQRVIDFKNASIKGWKYAFEHIQESVELVIKKYNSLNKSREALLFEAQELKKMAYYKTNELGKINHYKVQRIYDIYNVMGLLESKKDSEDIKNYIFVEDDKSYSILNKDEKEYIHNREKVKICVIPDALPYSKIDKDKYIGMGADYLNLVTKKVSLEFELVPTKTWKESLEFIKQRKCDLLPTAAKTPSRMEYLNFTNEVFSAPLIIATRVDEIFISDISNVLNKKIGVTKGYSYIDMLKKEYPGINLVEVDSNSDGLKMVSNKELFAVVGDLVSIAYEIQRNNANNIKISGSIGDGLKAAMAVRNDDFMLLNILNKAIYDISEKETQEIYNRWISVEYKRQKDYTLAFVVALFMFLLILFIINRQKELNKQNKKLREIKDNFDLGQDIAGIGIWVYDHTKQTLEWTNGVYMIFELDPNSFKVSYESFMSYVHIDDREKLNTSYQKSIEKQTNYFIEHRIVLDNQKIKYVEERCNNYFDKNGNIIKSVGTVLDITARKKIQMKLHDLNTTLEERVKDELQKSRNKDQQMLHQSRLAQMGEMVSMIAHQWRQPLGAISATAVDMKLQIELDAYDVSQKNQEKECKEYFINSLESIDCFIKGLTTTIDDFRNFYKPNKSYNLKSVNSPIHTALKIVKQNLESHNISVVEDLDEPKEIEMYTNELVQVFLNIFKNAQDNFIENGVQDAEIIISTQNLRNGVEISICDNGGGISDNNIEKIFDPYFSTKNEKNGSGLGLYMSKMIIEEHHKAKLSVSNYKNSQDFCVGACFNIELKNSIH